MDNRIHGGKSEDPQIQQVIKGDENKTAENEDMKKFTDSTAITLTSRGQAKEDYRWCELVSRTNLLCIIS